jgi:hypothetical protein
VTGRRPTVSKSPNVTASSTSTTTIASAAGKVFGNDSQNFCTIWLDEQQSAVDTQTAAPQNLIADQEAFDDAPERVSV